MDHGRLPEPTFLEAEDGTAIAVYDTGDPALPAAVVAHGVGSSPRYVHEAFSEPLAAAGHRLVAYDMRGHGRSDRAVRIADHDRRVHASDLGVVVDSVGARIAGGISLGAHAAATWAAGSAPDLDGLVLCIPALTGRVAPGEGPHAALAAEVRDVGVAGLLERIATDRQIRPWLAAALLSLDGGEGPTLDELGQISLPVGVAAWPEDPGHPLATAAAWADALPLGAFEVTSLDAVGEDPSALGATALRALTVAAASPNHRGHPKPLGADGLQ